MESRIRIYSNLCSSDAECNHELDWFCTYVSNRIVSVNAYPIGIDHVRLIIVYEVEE